MVTQLPNALFDPQPLWISPQTPMLQAISLMQQQGSAYGLVGSPPQLLGLLTEGMIISTLLESPSIRDLAVIQVISKAPLTLKASDYRDLETTQAFMHHHRVEYLPVFEQHGFIGVITFNRIQSAQLRQKIAELNAFFESALDLLCIADESGYFIALNPEWERVLGYSLAELQAHPFIEFVHPDDREATLSTAHLSQQQTIFNFTNRYRHRDSSYRWLEWRSYPQGSLIYGSARDITRHKQLEINLKAQSDAHQLLANLIQRIGQSFNLNDIFDTTTKQVSQSLAVDQVTIRRYCPTSQTWKLEINYKRDHQIPDTTGLTFPEAIASRLRQGLIVKVSDTSQITDSAKTSSTPLPEAWLILPIPIDTQIWGALSLKQWYCPCNWPDRQIKLLQQMTTQLGFAIQHAELYQKLEQELFKRQQIEVELIKAREQAEAASQAKTHFLTTMSHEIRTPLNAVIGAINLLQQTPLVPAQQQLADIIFSGSEILLTTISDILDISQIEAGQLELAFEPLDLHQVVQVTLTLLQEAAAQKRLQLSSWIDPSAPRHIIGDATRLKQILINLINNAIKFTDVGSINVRVESVVLDPSSHRYQILFTVQDTGIGIPPEKLDLIFQPFQQADNSTTRQYDGSGLGLAICRYLCEQMGGQIRVTSQLQLGSTFTFTIQATAIENTVIQLLDAHKPKLGPLQVLIVEDNSMNQMVVKLMTQSLGHTCELVSNGIEALAALGSNTYDLILMDIQMPDMDGLTATRMIRDRYGFQPFIVGLSASAFEDSRQRAMTAGMNDYLTKPLRLEALSATLQQAQARTSTSNLRDSATPLGASSTRPLDQSPSPLSTETNKPDCYAPEVLQDLRQSLGSQATVVIPRIIQTFLSDTTQRLQKLEAAYTQADFEQLRKLAHGLKGTSSQVGAITLHRLATELEALSLAKSSTKMKTLLQQMTVEYAKVSVALQTELA